MPEFDPDKQVKIKIPKDNGKSESVIRGSVNGQPYAIAVDQEVPVPGSVAQAIADSGIKFEVTDGDEAGLPSSSVAPLMDTATRDAPAVDPLADSSEDSDAPPTPALEGGDGDTGHGAPAAVPASEGRDLIEGRENAEGQGIAAQGGARVGNDTSDKASGADVTEGADNAHGQGSAEDDGDKANDEGDETQSEAETVTALKERIAKIDDVDALRAEHDAEAQGRKRTTALAAIDQRIDALTKSE